MSVARAASPSAMLLFCESPTVAMIDPSVTIDTMSYADIFAIACAPTTRSIARTIEKITTVATTTLSMSCHDEPNFMRQK